MGAGHSYQQLGAKRYLGDSANVWIRSSKVIRADDLARAMVGAVASETGQRGGPVFENRDIRAMVELLQPPRP